MFEYKFHQVAIYHPFPDRAVNKLRAMGFSNWVSDAADLTGQVYGEPLETHATMYFNYEIGPDETLLFTYRGPSWHSFSHRTDPQGFCELPFVSHKSVYVEDLDKAVAEMRKQHFYIPQEFETRNHTSEYLKGRGERFREAIVQTRHLFGFDLALVQRIFD